jgi:release factor glutamine methyltransferase
MDVGTGSGIVALELAGKGWSVVATDLSGEAVVNALENAEALGLRDRMEFVRADLLQFLREGARIDLMVFNAPYLPSPEPMEDSYTYSWHGGSKGGEIIERLIEIIEERGLEVVEILLIYSTLSQIEGGLSRLRGMGYRVEVADERPDFFHRIILLRATKSPNKSNL